MQKVLLDQSIQDGFLTFLEDLAVPRALTVAILMRYGEWDQLSELKYYPKSTLLMSSKDTVGINVVKREYQASELLRKAKFLPTSFDLDERARKSFIASEIQCAKTNRRLEGLHRNALPAARAMIDPTGRITALVARIRADIKKLLGPVPDQINPGFGPGSVIEAALEGVGASGLTVLDKLDRLQPAVTAECFSIFQHYYRASAWGRWNHSRWSDPQLVRADRFATVTKDSTKHRVIGVPPGGNIWVQKGIGDYMRMRLQTCWKLLLPEGKSEQIHHLLAQLWELFATVDLSNASDTVARLLVELFFPEEWYELLDACRVKFTQVDGRFYLLEKFSAMGNGFTFELETIIFAAIARALVDSGFAGQGRPKVSVYGDDIIVPVSRAQDVISALRFFGFTTNERKTFVQGYFRESCGGDFMAGVSVAPMRVTDLPREPEHWISLCNGIHRTWDRESRGDPGHRFWYWAHAQIPRHVQKCQGPSEYGDVCIHWNHPRMVWMKKTQRWTPRLYQPAFVHKPMDRHDPNAILAYALLGGSSEGPVPRGDEWISGFRAHEPVECACTPRRRCAQCRSSSEDFGVRNLGLQTKPVVRRSGPTLPTHLRAFPALNPGALRWMMGW